MKKTGAEAPEYRIERNKSVSGGRRVWTRGVEKVDIPDPETDGASVQSSVRGREALALRVRSEKRPARIA